MYEKYEDVCCMLPWLLLVAAAFAVAWAISEIKTRRERNLPGAVRIVDWIREMEAATTASPLWFCV